MTDGIIQQVFLKYLLTPYVNSMSNKRIMKELQQELIEKIKQLAEKDYHSHYYYETCNCKTCYVFRQLIGDNQE